MSTISSLKRYITVLGGSPPNTGTGKRGVVLKSDLIETINRLEGSSPHITAIRESNESLYKAVRYDIYLMPDLRPEYTMRQMKEESFDPWRRLYDELIALGRDDDFAKEENDLMNSILNGNLKELTSYFQGSIIERFIITYPALTWVLSRVSPKKTAVPMMISINRLDLLQDLTIKINYIDYINTIASVKVLIEKNPTLHVTDNIWNDGITKGIVGVVMWGLLDENRGIDPSANNNQAIRFASEKGHTEVVKILLGDHRIDPSDDNNHAIRLASEYGHTEVVKILLKDSRVDPSANNNQAIIYASVKGHTEIVKILLEDHRVDTSDDNNGAIRYASRYGHTKIVKILLKDGRVDPSDSNNQAIKLASEKGHTEIVKILLKDSRVDPSADNNGAIKLASANGRTEIVKILLKDSRVDPSDGNNEAIRYASANGHIEIVKILAAASKLK